MIDLVTASGAETEALARRLGARLRGGDVVALTGPLGAGKTCFVRGLAAGLGLDPGEVASPTYLLCHEYGPGPDPARPLVLAHLDGYRLEGPEALEGLGWEELLDREDVVVAVEWAERLGAALPPRRIDVAMSHCGRERRAITIDLPEALSARAAEIVAEIAAG